MNDTELLLAVLGGLMLVCLLVLAGVVLTGRAFTTLADTLHGMVEMALMVTQQRTLPSRPSPDTLASPAAAPPAEPPDSSSPGSGSDPQV